MTSGLYPLFSVCSAKGHIAPLRSHINKEDNILYPLAERVLPAAVRSGMLQSYDRAESRTPGLERKYRALVESYEQLAAA